MLVQRCWEVFTYLTCECALSAWVSMQARTPSHLAPVLPTDSAALHWSRTWRHHIRPSGIQGRSMSGIFATRAGDLNQSVACAQILGLALVLNSKSWPWSGATRRMP